MRFDSRTKLRFWGYLLLILVLFGLGVAMFLLGLVQLVVAFSEQSLRSYWPPGVLFTLVGLVLLAGIPVAAMAAQRETDPQRRGGRCRCCGYDLRPASSTRCPECGEPLGGRSGRHV